MKKIYLGDPVPPEDFIGRETIIDELLYIIANDRNEELIGPHRSGKSALCEYLVDLLKKEGRVVPHIVNLQRIESPTIKYVVSSITQKLIDETEYLVHSDFKKHIGVSHIPGPDGTAVKQLIEFVKEKNQPFVIFLDEMDVGLSDKYLYEEWNSSLRSLNHAASFNSCPAISIIKIFSGNPASYEKMAPRRAMISRAATNSDPPIRTG